MLLWKRYRRRADFRLRPLCCGGEDGTSAFCFPLADAPERRCRRPPSFLKRQTPDAAAAADVWCFLPLHIRFVIEKTQCFNVERLHCHYSFTASVCEPANRDAVQNFRRRVRPPARCKTRGDPPRGAPAAACRSHTWTGTRTAPAHCPPSSRPWPSSW